MPNNNSSLYGTTSNVTVSANNLTTLYNATGGNVKSVAVPDRNLTTLYPSAVSEVNPTKSYGNANVERFLNSGTDGGNTITNIIATGNVTADYFIGNLVGNIVGNANYANFAGNVVLGNQPNITAVGNLINLTIQDSNTAATDQVVWKFNPLDVVGGKQGIEFDLYANAANSEFNDTEAYVRYRGTPASPAPAGTNDLIQKTVSYAYNGNTLLRAAQFATGVSNVVANSSFMAGGYFSFETGNPYGNVTDPAPSNASSVRNTLAMGDIGELRLTQGNTPPTGVTAQITTVSYGRNTAAPNISGGMNFLRARGNREGNLSLQASDEIIRIGAVPYNGSAFSSGPSNGGSFGALVGNSYVANSANVPIDFRVRVVDSNNFASNTWFRNDGSMEVANSVTVNSNLTVVGQTNLGAVANVHITGGSANYALVTDGNGNLSWGQVANSASSNYANYAGNLINGNSNVNTNGSGGNISISVGGVANVATFANNSINLNYPINTPNNIFIGNNAGNRTAPQSDMISIGANAGLLSNNQQSISIGIGAGRLNQGNHTVAIGAYAASSGQKQYAVAIGDGTGQLNQGDGSVGLGLASGQTNQGNAAVAIGYAAGYTNQSGNSVAIGRGAGSNAQGQWSVGIGEVAGGNLQNAHAIAIGYHAGAETQGYNSVAIGHDAGNINQGGNSIAIGAGAGLVNQANNSIVLNATGSTLNQTTANTFTVKPVRNANTANAMFYNNTTGEITYDILTFPNSVANANYANFAGTAYSVSGSNVVGDVAGANHANIADVANSVSGSNVVGDVSGANHANIADVANSVSVANVVGIGNIATINLDGNVSNILHGNGFWGPELSNGNANYSNFAGTLINGNSNITMPVASSTIRMSVAGNANVVSVDGNGTMSFAPVTGGYNNQLVIQSFGRAGNSGAQRLLWNRARGNSTTPLSVQPNDNIIEIVGIANNGTSVYTNAIVNFRAVVDSSYVANSTIIPAGWQLQVANLTGSQITHSFFANGDVSFSNGNLVSGKNFSGNMLGDGSQLNSLTGANVTGAVPYATTANSVAVANVVGIGNIATINLDGNASNILHGNGSWGPDIPAGNANYANYSGNALVLANGTSNISILSNNQILFGIGGNSNVAILNNGQFTANPGSNVNNGLVVNSYGNPLGDVHRISSFRYRGNTTTPLSVNPNDATMRFLTAGSNGTALQTNSIASLTARVDSSYVANGANIPIGWQISVNDTNGGINNQTRTHNFYSNGNVNLNRDLFVSGNTSITGNILGSTGTLGVTGNITVGNVLTVTGKTYLNNDLNATGNVSFNLTGGQFTSSNGLGGASFVYFGGDKTTNSSVYLNDMPFVNVTNNIDPTSGYSPFRFDQYQNVYSYIAPWRFFRSRGTDYANALPVSVGDQAWNMDIAVHSSFSTYTPVSTITSEITYDNGVDSVGGSFTFSSGYGPSGYDNSEINFNAANTNISGNLIVTGNIDYTRAYGQFQYNSTVSPVAANTAYVFPLGTADISNVVTVASTSHLIPGKAGKFNLQFSIQVDNADNANDHTAYIWLRKNGTDVTGSMGRVTIPKNNAGSLKIVAWNYLIDSSNTSDYWELAYAASNTNITFPAYAATAFGPSTACIITSLVPVGA